MSESDNRFYREPRDREADRARFPNPDFNRWLDEAITENGEYSVWHQIGDIATAWAAWEARPYYDGSRDYLENTDDLDGLPF